ncbi:MAG: HIT family protein [Holosporales bacterium]|jgi:diadenosine tetraphosphate (Ap4A) HIT family hydrolase|nr:HIT family protein [Holosporales bacterium]
MADSAVDYEYLQIESFAFWDLYLHGNQYYLGRTYVLSKRQEQFDMFEIEEREYAELRAIVSAVKDVLREAFAPDLFNYASLGNVFHRLHLHIIPRYKTERVFSNTVFVDKNWGSNYAPYDKDFRVGVDVYDSLKVEFKKIESEKIDLCSFLSQKQDNREGIVKSKKDLRS